MHTYKNILLTFSCFLLITMMANTAESASIKGHVLDSKTNEALTGALIYVKDNTNLNDVARLDGSYSITNLGPGKYTVVSQFIGFVKQEKEVVINDGNHACCSEFIYRYK